MNTIPRLAALALAIALAATGCAGSDAPDADGPDASASTDFTVIDVRTPAEFAAGHLEGAINIDESAPGFEQEVDALPRDADYVVYCHNGIPSGSAIATMRDLGFENLTDAGPISRAAASTGLAVITPDDA